MAKEYSILLFFVSLLVRTFSVLKLTTTLFVGRHLNKGLIMPNAATSMHQRLVLWSKSTFELTNANHCLRYQSIMICRDQSLMSYLGFFSTSLSNKHNIDIFTISWSWQLF